MRQTVVRLIGLLCVAVLTPAAWAATPHTPPADTLNVDYFSNANTPGAPDGELRMTNPGTTGDLWSAIYIFDPEQEMSECCACFSSVDGGTGMSINNDLTNNPLTGVILTTGLIKIVSTEGTNAYQLIPTPSLRGWTTHIQNGSFAVTETASQNATLSTAEVNRLEAECSGIQTDGSGKGICGCGSGE